MTGTTPGEIPLPGGSTSPFDAVFGAKVAGEARQLAFYKWRSEIVRVEITNNFGKLVVAIVCFCGTAGLHAANVNDILQRYQPRAIALPKAAGYLTADGAVRITGYNDMRDMLEALGAIFAKAQPGVRFEWDLRGTRFAPAALAAGTSAFAPMGAEFTPTQLAEFRAATGEEPLAIRVAHASLDPQALSGPLGIFVHRDNPLTSLTLAQAARVFTGEAGRWGDLGLTGAWADRPIRTYGVERDRVLAQFLRERALDGHEFAKEMRGFPQSADVVKKIGEDASGIGFAAAMRTFTGVRTLAIAARAGERAVAPTAEDIMAGAYPLDRFLLIYVRRPILPVAREFLRLVLSSEGQAAVASASQGYLPLYPNDAAAERAKLD